MSGISIIQNKKSAAPEPTEEVPDEQEEEEEEEAPVLIDHTIPDMSAVLDRVDVVIQVLDARDPLSFRITDFEKTVLEKGKKHILLLNKIGK